MDFFFWNGERGKRKRERETVRKNKRERARKKGVELGSRRESQILALFVVSFWKAAEENHFGIWLSGTAESGLGELA